MSISPTVSNIYTYPVKGLSPHGFDRVVLKKAETLPFDRIYAIENGPGRFNLDEPKHLSKINFIMLMRDEKLATLKTVFDEETHLLTVFREGKPVAKGNLQTVVGRQMLEQFFAAYMKGSLRGRPKVLTSPGHSFSDVKEKCLHIINLETVKDIEHKFNQKINPLRFRANLYIQGLAAWKEFDLMDQDIQIGEARLRIFKRTMRCDATNVNPETGERDRSIPPNLLRTYQHSDCGVYAMVVQDGVIQVGDEIKI